MKKPTCTLYIKICTCTFFFFLFLPQRNAKKKKKKKKKRTGNSYNLIANHFHVKTASKYKLFKFIRKRNKRFFVFFCCCFYFLTRVFSICPGRKSRTENCLFLKGGGSFGVSQVKTVE